MQTDFEAQIRSLLHHPSFRALRRRRERFRPFRALGIEWREHSHSEFLAYLLDPGNPHGLGEQFLRDFIAQIVGTESGKSCLPVRDELSIIPEKVSVSRERYGIDILVDCHSNGPVIGVEVKIWAGEQENQIQNYQEVLKARYPGRRCLVVFLTPYGSKPETGDKGHDVPYVTMSWSDVASLIEDILGDSETGEARPFIAAFARHLREVFMGSTEEERELAAKLFKDPEIVNLFRTINEIRPKLSDKSVHEKLIDECKNVTRSVTGFGVRRQSGVETGKGMKAYVRLIPERWEKEFKLPICFVFYQEPGWSKQQKPAMHVVLYQTDVEDEGNIRPEVKEEWEKIAKDSKILASTLNRLPEWQAYKVLNDAFTGSDRELTGWIFDDESFDDEWIKSAAEQFEEILKQIDEELNDKK